MKKTIRAIVLIMACLMFMTAFVSCGRSFDGVKEKAEKEGYTCVAATADELKAYSEHFNVTVNNILTIKGEGADKFVTVFFFDKIDGAKDALVSLEQGLSEMHYTNSVTERKGKVVITGNAEMVDKIW